MVQGVEKPVPKPRKNLPNPVPRDLPKPEALPEDPLTSIEVSTSSFSVNSSYGWDPSITKSPSPALSDSSYASAVTTVTPPPTSLESTPNFELSPISNKPTCIEPPNFPPPKLPIGFKNYESKDDGFFLPVQPAPPIPPRSEKILPLPDPIPNEEEILHPSCNTSVISDILREEELVRLSMADTISLASETRPKIHDDSYDIPPNGHWYSRHDSLRSGYSLPSQPDMYSFLDPAVVNDILYPILPNNGAPKAQGETICLSAWVILKTGKKESKRVMASIRNRHLSFMPSEEIETPLYGPYDLSRLLFVGKSIENASDIIVVLKSVKQGQKNSHGQAEILKFAPEDNFDFWICLLAKCNCPDYKVLQESINEMNAGGKVYIREGTTGCWEESYAFTRHNDLHYFVRRDEEVKCLDIRKFRNVKMDVPVADYCNHIPHSQMGPLMIVLDGLSIFLQNESDGATRTWYNLFQAELRRPSRRLSECRLTSEDVPVILDRCIKFVSIYGLRQPGLYRKNGITSEAKSMFEALKNDPFETHLKYYNDETVNAAADVLRTFLRQLDVPLIVPEIQAELYTIYDRYHIVLLGLAYNAEKQDYRREVISDKINEYRYAIQTMPPVHYSTLKKLLGHLVEVNAFESENLASQANLARVFGPTIFCSDKNTEVPTSSFGRTGLQIAVMKDFIDLYEDLFEVSPDKVAHDIDATEVAAAKCASKPKSVGFLIPIHYKQHDVQSFNVQAHHTAEEVVQYRKKIFVNSEGCENKMALYEVIKDGALERRICDNETISSIALKRWLTWKAADAYLLLKKECFVYDPNNARPFAEDVKVCEPGSKTFKTVQLQIDNGITISQYPKAQEKVNKPQKQWPVADTVWFTGNIRERRYPPNYPYTVTFLSVNEKYNSKLPGYCVAFNDETRRNQWLTAVMSCQWKAADKSENI